MTREEAIRFLKRDHCWKGVPPDTQMAIETLMQQLSLPSNLDEAADAIVDGWLENNREGWYKDLVIAGAEWMAGQGESITADVVEFNGGKMLSYDGEFAKLVQKRSFGDKVIVQIRKK